MRFPRLPRTPTTSTGPRTGQEEGFFSPLCHLAAAVLFVSLSLSSCANPSFFPRLRPLFAGLDESHLPPDKRVALQKAKVDFQRARHGQPPLYAHFTGDVPYSHSLRYAGDGYVLTWVHTGEIHRWAQGPDIVLSGSLTGGNPYHYDELDYLGE